MGPIAVAKHLHAMVVTVDYNNMPRAIERDASGIRELAGPGSLAADGADMRAVTVADNLHSIVTMVGNNKVAFTVKSDTTTASSELSVAAASAADGAHEGAVAHSKHLHASVAVVKNSDVALAVHSDAGGRG